MAAKNKSAQYWSYKTAQLGVVSTVIVSVLGTANILIDKLIPEKSSPEPVVAAADEPRPAPYIVEEAPVYESTEPVEEYQVKGEEQQVLEEPIMVQEPSFEEPTSSMAPDDGYEMKWWMWVGVATIAMTLLGLMSKVVFKLFDKDEEDDQTTTTE